MNKTNNNNSTLLKREHTNPTSFILGISCLLVVYLHSEWVGGFDIYTFGTDNNLIRKIVSLILMTVVPIFFILWGYLAYKYFFSTEAPTIFVKRKIIQFYPIYLASYLFHLLLRHFTEPLDLHRWEILLGMLGVYYTKGLRGGNIYVPVLAVILTIAISKRFVQRKPLLLPFFTVVCLIATKILPHENDFYLIKYFGYFAAFFFGATIKHYNLLPSSEQFSFTQRICIASMLFVAIATPALNYLGINFLEVQYNPNSFEQLFLCYGILLGLYTILLNSQIVGSRFFLVRYLHTLGNNAYFHYIIQTIVIRLIILGADKMAWDTVITQLVVIISTSFISIFIIKRGVDYAVETIFAFDRQRFCLFLHKK